MVERVSKAVEFSSGNRAQVQSAAGGFAPVRPEGTARQVTVTEGYPNRVLGDLLGKSLTTLGPALLQRSQEDAYLEGAAQVGKAESEAALEGNPLTRDWAVAGYRDATFKLMHAKETSKIEDDLKNGLREKSPEEFSAYMQQMRDRLTPHFDGMSAEARKQAVQQLTNTQEVAFNAYTREHGKFIVEVEASANMASWQSLLTASQRAKIDGSPIEYANATKSLLTALTGMYTNPRLPQDVRNNLVAEAAEQAISSGDTALWGALKELPYEAGDGSKAPLLDRLPYQMQTRLADKARQAAQNGMSDQKMAYMDNLAQLEAKWSTGQEVDPVQAKAFIDQGARQGFIQAGAYNSLLQNMYVSVEKHKGSSALIQNYQSSVINETDLGGKTKKEVRDAWVAGMYKRGMTDDQVLDALTLNGTKVGNVESLELVGASVKPIMQKLSSADAAPLTQEENTRLSKVLTTLNQLTVQNKQGAVAALLGGMPEEQRVFMETVRSKVAGGILNDAAIREASTQLRSTSSLSAQDRVALYNQKTGEDTKRVQDVVKGGFINWIGEKFTFGAQGDVIAQAKSQRNTGVVAQALLEEMRSLGVANPGTDVDVRYNVALANVSQRLVDTGENMMLMPRGVSVQQFFNVPANTDNARVGKALQSIAGRIDETKGKSLYYSAGVDGKVQVDAWSGKRGEEGAAMYQSYIIEPTQIKSELEKMAADLAKKANRVFGSGKTFTQGAASVNFNGMSSTNADPTVMFKLRNNLVKNEGVRDTVYKDSRGNQTAGVGVANEFLPKPGPDGKISQQDIDLSFAKASDAAANAAMRIQAQTGLRGDKWFLVIGELAYQSGPGFTSLPQYQGLLSAIRSGDTEKAVQAFYKTPAYKVSGDERKSHYERLLRSAMTS